MQRYIVTKKTTEENPTGKILLDTEFTDREGAVSALRKLFAGGVQFNQVDVKIITDDDLPPVVVPEEQLAVMLTPPRKPRSDAGKPHKVAEKPAKKVRNRGQYFVLPDNTPTFCHKR